MTRDGDEIWLAPMMRPALVNGLRFPVYEVYHMPCTTGAVGYDENGDHYAQTYPPRGMRCS